MFGAAGRFHKSRVTGAVDPYFANVSLLLHGDGVDGGTVFTDSSNNALTPTVTPNIITSVAVLPPLGHITAIRGTTGYLMYAANSLFALGAAFTVECFFYASSYSSYNIIFNTVWNAGGIQLYVSTVGTVTLESALGSIALSAAFALNQWNHLALQYNGINLEFYYNGTKTYSVAKSLNLISQNPLYIGKDNGAVRMNGNLSELRITKGIARYSANFTPPTAAFPNQ